ncbi:MAG TPA: TetR/AcrR family transcriptional regulator [Dongiaceae bacterium]|nr:TetR/AcrR family transcriptional regulator [Dongiaceae bacterium]
MARKPQIKPRKKASQQRSQVTVDVLLEATARILVKDGYDTASTNKIAQMAGVSIGSLYQYFPGKEALVAAVTDQHFKEMMAVARDALVNVMVQPVETAVRELVRVMIDAHRVNPKLHRVLFEQIPRMGRTDDMDAFDREAFGMVRTYLEHHRAELNVADLELTAFICVKTVETLTHTAVVNHPALIAGAKQDLFIDETTRMLVRYLKGK